MDKNLESIKFRSIINNSISRARKLTDIENYIELNWLLYSNCNFNKAVVILFCLL